MNKEDLIIKLKEFRKQFYILLNEVDQFLPEHLFDRASDYLDITIDELEKEVVSK